MPPSVDVLGECFALDALSGVVRWRARPRHHFTSDKSFRSWNSRFAGTVAGADHGRGYRHVSINGKLVLLHRLVFALHNGRWPNGQIDHANGDRSDNRPENLREATPSQNRMNERLRAGSESGVRGVNREPNGKWRARLKVDGKELQISGFDTVEAAAKARKTMLRLHGAFARS